MNGDYYTSPQNSIKKEFSCGAFLHNKEGEENYRLTILINSNESAPKCWALIEYTKIKAEGV
jgi:hypothetical protein